MDIIRNFDKVVLDALEKDEEIEAEIGDMGTFSNKIFGLIPWLPEVFLVARIRD